MIFKIKRISKGSKDLKRKKKYCVLNLAVSNKLAYLVVENVYFKACKLSKKYTLNFRICLIIKCCMCKFSGTKFKKYALISLKMK